MDEKRSCTTQFVINKYPKDERDLLQKEEVCEEVSKYADVDIVIRGRYVPPKEVAGIDSNRLLHLHIIGRTKQNLNLAIQKLELILEKYRRRVEADKSLEEKITIGIETFPSIFRMRDKILGEHNENVDYLTKETGAIITLRGKGSGSPENKDDELHVFVKYLDLESKPRTQELVLNLIETVQQDFVDNYGKYYPRPKTPEILPVKKPEIKVKKKKTPPPPKEPVKTTKNVSNDTENHIEKITLGLKHVPIKFNLKSKIYGPNLSNVKHIEKVTSAVLLVEGVTTIADGGKVNPSESPHILVKYMKPEMKDKARSLILNLIETIHQEFESLYGAYLEKPEAPEILPIKSTSHFSKPSPTETATKIPPGKSQSPPVQKQKENSLLDPRKIIDKPQPVERPIIPPPPVISKSSSPDYLGFTNHSVNTAEQSEKVREEPVRSFSRPIELAGSSYPMVDPIRPAYADVNRPNISYGVQNVKPIPSMVPSVRPQPLLPTPPYVPPPSTYEDLPGIPLLSNMLPLPGIQPVLGNDLPQYYKKRSISPGEMGLEPKKFCTPPLLATPLPYLGNIESIENFNVPCQEPPRPRVTTANNRYLVELPLIKSNPSPAKPKPKTHTAKPAASQNVEPPRLPIQSTAASRWNASVQTNPQVAANKPADAKWPTTSVDQPALPPRIPASWNPKLPSTEWEATLSSQQTKVSQSPAAANSVRKPVSLKLRGPVKHQVNGKPVADGDAVMSFLKECAKTAEANKYDIYDNSQDEETKSVIVIESDEEAFDDAVKPVRRKAQKRSIAVQTDERVHQTNVRCACGRFSKSQSDIRSVSVQTTPFKYGQQF